MSLIPWLHNPISPNLLMTIVAIGILGSVVVYLLARNPILYSILWGDKYSTLT